MLGLLNTALRLVDDLVAKITHLGYAEQLYERELKRVLKDCRVKAKNNDTGSLFIRPNITEFEIAARKANIDKHPRTQKLIRALQKDDSFFIEFRHSGAKTYVDESVGRRKKKTKKEPVSFYPRRRSPLLSK